MYIKGLLLAVYKNLGQLIYAIQNDASGSFLTHSATKTPAAQLLALINGC